MKLYLFLKKMLEKDPSVAEKKNGFILLFAVLSIGFLLVITINLANSLYKQHKFLSFSSESLDALNNSNAGLECAMYWDRTADAFSKPSTIKCGRQSFEVGKTLKSTFTLLNDDATQSTVVEVDKTTEPGTTTIRAEGYNTANPSSDKRVNRTLEVSYADREVSNKCADFDIVLLLDISSSLVGQERTDSADAAKIIVNNLQFGPTLAQMGVVWYFANSNVQLPLSTNPANINNAIDYSYKNVAIFGDTNLPWALMNAKNELQAHGRPNSPKFAVIVTDGETNECSSLVGGRVYCPGETTSLWARWKSMTQSLEYAQILKDAHITVITVAVALQHQTGGGIDDVTVEEYKDFLKGIATKDEYYEVADAAHLHELTEGFDCSFFSRVRGTPVIKEQ